MFGQKDSHKCTGLSYTSCNFMYMYYIVCIIDVHVHVHCMYSKSLLHPYACTCMHLSMILLYKFYIYMYVNFLLHSTDDLSSPVVRILLSSFRQLCSLLWLLHVRDQASAHLRKLQPSLSKVSSSFFIHVHVHGHTCTCRCTCTCT